MVTVNDVLHHVAQELYCYSGSSRYEEVQGFLVGRIVQIHLSITTDIEATELNYLSRFGRGNTFYFRLKDYGHGKDLAAQLYFAINNKQPALDGHTGELFQPEDKLYLFVHVQDVNLQVT